MCSGTTSQPAALEHPCGERPGGAVAGGDDDLELALELRPVGQRLHVALGDVGLEDVAAAVSSLVGGAEHDLLELRHFLGAECQRPLQAHLDAGPAVVVVARRDHGDALDVEVELGEVGHRRDGEADVVHLGATGHQPDHQRLLHAGRVRAVVVADDDALWHAAAAKQRGDAEADSVEPHEIDLVGKEPARVVLAKSRRLDERQALELERYSASDRHAGEAAWLKSCGGSGDCTAGLDAAGRES